MPGRPFIVTGAGRSGTQFTAELFTLLGVRTSWELFFDPPHDPPPLDGLADAFAERDVQGEASWFAAPYLVTLPEDVVVLHQVRNPVAVIRSLVGINLWTRGWEKDADHVEFVCRHVPGIDRETDPTVASMRYWVAWNRMVEPRAAVRYRLEALSDPSGVVASGLLALVGEERETWRVQVALKMIRAQRVNRGRHNPALAWADLPDGPDKDAVAEMAERYGYGEYDLNEA